MLRTRCCVLVAINLQLCILLHCNILLIRSVVFRSRIWILQEFTSEIVCGIAFNASLSSLFELCPVLCELSTESPEGRGCVSTLCFLFSSQASNLQLLLLVVLQPAGPRPASACFCVCLYLPAFIHSSQSLPLFPFLSSIPFYKTLFFGGRPTGSLISGK